MKKSFRLPSWIKNGAWSGRFRGGKFEAPPEVDPMTRFPFSIALLLAFLISPSWSAGTEPFVVDELLDGVWLFRAPGHEATHTNSLVIDRESGLFVVDSQPSPAAAEQLLKAIAEVSDKPVQYLLLTHAHVESTGGASAFPKSTLLIASMATHLALADQELDLSGETRLRAPDPDSWEAPPRVRPDWVLSSGTQLMDGERVVEVLRLHGGHYPGSLIVRIEDAGLYYVGSAVVTDRNPFADAKHSDLRAWIHSLNSLSVLRPKLVVPSRGRPIDSETVRRFRDSLTWVVGQIENAFIEGIHTDKVIDFAMDTPRLEEYFDVEIDPSFVLTLFEAAFKDAAAQRRKRNLAP
jgi:glyoxylase-like metal-dependent hydrolase (beta-lactamase superfamily II)